MWASEDSASFLILTPVSFIVLEVFDPFFFALFNIHVTQEGMLQELLHCSPILGFLDKASIDEFLKRQAPSVAGDSLRRLIADGSRPSYTSFIGEWGTTSRQLLGKASHGPHIDLFGVLFAFVYQLWTEPLGCATLSTPIFVLFVKESRETKVGKLDVAVHAAKDVV